MSSHAGMRSECLVLPDGDDTKDLQERVNQPKMRRGDPLHAVQPLSLISRTGIAAEIELQTLEI